MKRRGFGVEDAPFMILVTVLVMMLVVWIAMGVMASFIEGNERQAAVDAAAEIYKRARLVSLGYDGSSERVSVSIPRGYGVLVDGYIVPLGSLENSSDPGSVAELTERLDIRGVDIISDTGLIPSGEHEINLVYSSKNARVIVSW